MRFLLDDEQRAFARSLDGALKAADTPAVARAWAAGDHAPGAAVWRRLADAGVFALAAAEEFEGVGQLPVDTAVAFVELGRHAVPGPLVETVAAAALLSRLAELGVPGPAKRLLPSLVTGEARATLALAGTGPYVLDADAAGLLLAVDAGRLRLAPGHARVRASLDPARRLARPLPGGEVLASGPAVEEAARWALRWAALTTAAQCLGVGCALLDRTVAHVRQRTQFGVPVGSFQAVKHRLAEVLVGLEFARPLVFGAAVSLGAEEAWGDVAAAKVCAAESAYRSARAALQLHGAIGYTAEYDISLWLLKARALRGAWGGPGQWRARVVPPPP
ncbi:Acyl-CoA dehydrogenase, short-chain specific [Streptomyces sp. YIM 121038]|uniref:acyl-CoA dehydrogenase family protein n=1 Tax=Streptomyces sp. YIM 121038 TaxID=2136401 RepID=UPI0011106DF4|nr:acyl-CoA dehydrogenase family protein [Streptomyces sp. YIM 121038]QCX80166.1 Acyl-CoA dehydrogenase, short-chain specific [Streptomyces sp. YIM 121038]